MFETDEDLARDVKDVATRLVTDRPLPADVRRRVRQQRRLRAVSSVGAIAAVVTLVAISLAALLPLGGGPPSQGVGPASEPASSPPFVTHGSSAGVKVTLPSAWTFENGTDITMIDPTVDFVAGSWNFPTHGDCAPTAAIESLPSDGVLFWLVEYTSPNTPVNVPARPERMDLGPLVGPLECVGTSAHVVGFSDAGREFQMFVVLGSDAGDSVRREAADALNSIVVAPGPTPGTSGRR
jgi:hypothetical protein